MQPRRRVDLKRFVWEPLLPGLRRGVEQTTHPKEQTTALLWFHLVGSLWFPLVCFRLLWFALLWLALVSTPVSPGVSFGFLGALNMTKLKFALRLAWREVDSAGLDVLIPFTPVYFDKGPPIASFPLV